MCKVYDIVNQRIMELLQQGTVPWRKKWHAASNYPKNLITKKEYRGINIWLLASSEFCSPYWLTFKQCQDKGGHVRKGEKSTPVIFWKWIDRKDADSANDKAGGGKVPLLRYYSVFNMEQTEGIEAPALPEITSDHEPLALPEQIIKEMPHRPDIRFGGNRACYSPVLDYVQLPHLSSFETPEEFYCCMYHELSHATGHASRVGRKGITEPSYFGSHSYSREELVAEMSAAFLCGHSGIENVTIENSAAYIAGWIKALKNDKTLLIHAAAQGQKAADYILNRKGGEDTFIEDTAE